MSFFNKLLRASFESSNVSNELKTLGLLTCFVSPLYFFSVDSANDFEIARILIARDMTGKRAVKLLILC